MKDLLGVVFFLVFSFRCAQVPWCRCLVPASKSAASSSAGVAPALVGFGVFSYGIQLES